MESVIELEVLRKRTQHLMDPEIENRLFFVNSFYENPVTFLEMIFVDPLHREICKCLGNKLTKDFEDKIPSRNIFNFKFIRNDDKEPFRERNAFPINDIGIDKFMDLSFSQDMDNLISNILMGQMMESITTSVIKSIYNGYYSKRLHNSSSIEFYKELEYNRTFRNNIKQCVIRMNNELSLYPSSKSISSIIVPDLPGLSIEDVNIPIIKMNASLLESDDMYGFFYISKHTEYEATSLSYFTDYFDISHRSILIDNTSISFEDCIQNCLRWGDIPNSELQAPLRRLSSHDDFLVIGGSNCIECISTEDMDITDNNDSDENKVVVKWCDLDSKFLPIYVLERVLVTLRKAKRIMGKSRNLSDILKGCDDSTHSTLSDFHKSNDERRIWCNDLLGSDDSRLMHDFLHSNITRENLIVMNYWGIYIPIDFLLFRPFIKEKCYNVIGVSDDFFQTVEFNSCNFVFQRDGDETLKVDSSVNYEYKTANVDTNSSVIPHAIKTDNKEIKSKPLKFLKPNDLTDLSTDKSHLIFPVMIPVTCKLDSNTVSFCNKDNGIPHCTDFISKVFPEVRQMKTPSFQGNFFCSLKKNK